MALSCNITTGSPEIGTPALLSWLPFERLYNYPALRKRAADAYAKQRYCAEKRGISWRFMFQSWWTLWAQSGKWDMRGRGLGRYQMARHGDTGDYASDNVKIILHEENVDERSYERHRAACKRRSRRASWRAAVRAAATSPEGRKQRSEIGLRREAAKRAAREASPS
jgi:hypothetical protein